MIPPTDEQPTATTITTMNNHHHPNHTTNTTTTNTTTNTESNTKPSNPITINIHRKTTTTYSNSNTMVHVHKDLLVRLIDFYANFHSLAPFWGRGDLVRVLLFGHRTSNYKNKHVTVRTFSVVYGHDKLVECMAKQQDENGNELLGFCMQCIDMELVVKKEFQFFHDQVIRHFFIHNEKLNCRTMLEKYIGLNIRCDVQDQIYGGEAEHFNQLLSLKCKAYAPYIMTDYYQEIYTNVLLSSGNGNTGGYTGEIIGVMKYRRDINLVIHTGQMSEFGCEILGEVEESQQVNECMEFMFKQNGSIEYLEKWIETQLQDPAESEIAKLLREYEQLEKENKSLREELLELSEQ